MSRDRSQSMNRRSGLLGWFDRIRFREVYRQALGLLLVVICAAMAEPGHGRVLAGLAIAAAGQLFRIFAAGTIFKNRQLATQGAYALVRHPLYLGNILILGGFSLACGSIWLAVVVLLFFLVWYPAAVAYEDAKLENLFGEAWRRWRRDTPAVFPRRLHGSRIVAAGWNARQSLLRNGELAISLYLIACAFWLWGRAHA